MTRRGAVWTLLAVAGLLMLVASARPWWRAMGAGAGVEATGAAEATVVFAGSDATGGLSQALAVVILAGLLLTLVLGAIGRRVVAVLLGLTGAAAALLGAFGPQPGDAAVRVRFRQLSLVEQFSLSGTAWPWIYAGAGALAVTGAILLWVGARRWPQRGQRFERRGDAPAPEVRTDSASDSVSDSGSADPGQIWRTLDAGADPTLDPSDDTYGGNRDPGVRKDVPTDTMDGRRDDSPLDEGGAPRDEQSGPGSGSESGSGATARQRNEER